MSTNAEGLQAGSGDHTFATQQMFIFSISEPLAEATINRPNTLVKGSITSLSGKETGVVVNGLPAMINGNEFAINHVPLQNGANTITAIATDVDGNIAKISIEVTTPLVDSSP